jgi:hypothetical protein
VSALKNQFLRARVILDSLVQGIHPKTGGELPEDSVVNEIDVARAMATAVLALDQISARIARRAQLPESVGKTWTEEEERQLKDEFNRNEPMPLIATKHGRTIRAIEARLERLGLLTADRRMTANPLLATTGSRHKK